MPRLEPSLENEWSLLRAACSASSGPPKSEAVRKLLTRPIRWNPLFELAARQGVLPLFCHGISDYSDLVSPQQLTAAKRLYQANVHKALFLAREMISILDCLESRGIEAMPYKGLVLAQSVYGDMALRQPGDIDLLIHPQDLPKIRDAVRELGYVPRFRAPEHLDKEHLRSAYECAFDGTAGRNLLEVQWAIQPRFYAVDFDLKGVFDRAVSIEVAGRPVKTPSPEDLFIILSLHAAKHVWGRLIWLCDLERILCSRLDWKWIALQVQQLGITRILHVTILLMKNLLGTEVPPDSEALPEDPASHALAREIETLIASSTPFEAESIAYFRLMLRLRERPTDRMRFLARLVFTPGPGEWDTLRLPSALAPFYRVIRLARLAARLLRHE